MTLKDDLVSALENVRIERQLQEQYKTEANELARQLAETELGQKLARVREQKDLSSSLLTKYENSVREIALELYDVDKDKHPDPHVEIKLFTSVTVSDEKKALKWAVENDPSAVKLDAKKLAKDAGSLELDFLTKTEEPRAQISSKLD
jgi:hypothetical protein